MIVICTGAAAVGMQRLTALAMTRPGIWHLCRNTQTHSSRAIYTDTNAFLKTTVRNNVSVLDFIVHYLLHVSAPIGGHPQAKCTQNILR
jgi:imidazolonepropionase-like amidohydrolase